MILEDAKTKAGISQSVIPALKRIFNDKYDRLLVRIENGMQKFPAPKSKKDIKELMDETTIDFTLDLAQVLKIFLNKTKEDVQDVSEVDDQQKKSLILIWNNRFLNS